MKVIVFDDHVPAMLGFLLCFTAVSGCMSLMCVNLTS